MTTFTYRKDEKFKSSAWKQKMSGHGDSLKRNHVRKLVLVHGTFAGNDALGLFDMLQPINKPLSDVLKKKEKL